MDLFSAELFSKKGYEVHGIIRRSSSFNTGRIDHIFDHKRLHLKYGDLVDSNNISIISEINPDEIYNLGAQSHVQVSFEIPEYSADVDALGTLRLLDAIRHNNSKAKFYQASTSELYGLVQEIPQMKKTPFYPRSPYAAARLYAFGLQLIIEKHSICLHVMEFFSIMSLKEEERHLLLEKYLLQFQK